MKVSDHLLGGKVHFDKINRKSQVAFEFLIKTQTISSFVNFKYKKVLCIDIHLNDEITKRYVEKNNKIVYLFPFN